MHLETLIKQKSYEHPEYELRRHPFVFFKVIIVFIFLVGLPILLYFAINTAYPGYLMSSGAFPFLVLGASVYYLSIWLFFLTEFTDYYLDLWVVTNDRIVNIEQHGLFGRTVAELDLYKVQDVTSDVRGMISTFLNYGNVHIQTAG
ncbi:MAG: PH domain-containing protein, partial [bacterium]|nr:PH domain-containing protein [bacterium]